MALAGIIEFRTCTYAGACSKGDRIIRIRRSAATGGNTVSASGVRLAQGNRPGAGRIGARAQRSGVGRARLSRIAERDRTVAAGHAIAANGDGAVSIVVVTRFGILAQRNCASGGFRGACAVAGGEAAVSLSHGVGADRDGLVAHGFGIRSHRIGVEVSNSGGAFLDKEVMDLPTVNRIRAGRSNIAIGETGDLVAIHIEIGTYRNAGAIRNERASANIQAIGRNQGAKIADLTLQCRDVRLSGVYIRSGSGDVRLGGGDICLRSRNICLGGGDICLRSGNVRSGGGNICLRSRNICLGGGDICLRSGNVRSSGGNICLCSSNICLGRGDVCLGRSDGELCGGDSLIGRKQLLTAYRLGTGGTQSGIVTQHDPVDGQLARIIQVNQAIDRGHAGNATVTARKIDFSRSVSKHDGVSTDGGFITYLHISRRGASHGQQAHSYQRAKPFTASATLAFALYIFRNGDVRAGGFAPYAPE